MKFQEKLSRMRKEKNLSQEALAEKLGMSRQAISKWESGNSYPDMATIIKVAKVLDCKIDDLIDDDVVGVKNTNNKINFNILLKDILDFITKTYNMFWSMKFFDKVKCIIEMLLIILVCYFCSYVFFEFLRNTILNLFKFLPSTPFQYLVSVFKTLYSILMFVVSFIVTLHLFKIRYLDYYVTVTDNDIEKKVVEEDINNEKEYKECKREKIIIRDNKHSANSIIDFFARIVVFLIKILVLFILMFLVFGFVFLVFLSTVSIVWIKYGLVFLGSFIFLLGFLLLVYVFIELMYKFIFNIKNNFKRLFVMFLSSLFVIGIGSGIIFLELSKFDYIYEDIKDNNTVLHIDVNNNTTFYELEYYLESNKVIIDDKVKDIEISVDYSNNIVPYINENNYIEYDVKDINYLKDILNNIKVKKIIISDNYNYNVKYVKLSKKSFDIIKKNNKLES